MFDVIVIGAGHAGIEAAFSACRKGAKVCLVTMNKSNIGELSCNPSIGGLGKGHIVKEIDALDGIMAKIIDDSGIHFKMLNASKGPAVRGPRAQADRDLYKKNSNKYLLQYIEKYNLTVIYDTVIALQKNANIFNIGLNNQGSIQSKSTIITTGTFLNGVIHIGKKRIKAGRINEESSTSLANDIKKLNFNMGRLKTGTPARLHKDSINWSVLEKQQGDNPPIAFSYMNKDIKNPQISCYIATTNIKTHEIIESNLSESSIYGGQINSKGPRYCPSIEDKVVRFSDKNEHQIFLEPEGLNSNLIYPNGISTSLSEKIQEKFIKSIKGLENAEIVQYGYAIEYDYINPQELKPSLETKKLKGLFLAGQIIGTTGYEEAAGQGLMAGINASNYVMNNKAFILGRDESYIGVMIDDLIHYGVKEPYRMFTARAEYRIHLRSDNADKRLTKKGHKEHVVNDCRYEEYVNKQEQIDSLKKELKEQIYSPNEIKQNGIYVNQDGIKRNLLQWLSYSNITMESIESIYLKNNKYSMEVKNIVDIDCKYDYYIKKQLEEIKKYKKDSNTIIPNWVDYFKIDGLQKEMMEKLNSLKPHSMAEVSKIEGYRPSTGIAIINYINKEKK